LVLAGRNIGGPLVVGALPGLVRVVELHLLRDVEGVRPHILLVDDAVIANDEGLYPRHAVFSWNGNQSKTADHDPLDHIVKLTQWSRRSLPFQYLEIIAVVGLRFARVAFLN